MESAQAQIEAKYKNKEIDAGQYRNFQRELEKTRLNLKDLESEHDKTSKTIQSGAQNIADETQKAAKETSVFGDVLKASLAADVVMGGINAIISGVQKLTGAVKNYVSTGIAEYQDMAENQAKVAQVMRNTMNASDDEIQSIYALADAYERVGVVSAEAQLNGAQELGTYLSRKDSLETLMPVMNDMVAQQYGVNASQESAVNIATMLGKVMNGQVGALSRYGYTFDEAQEKILKFGTEEEKAAVLAEVVSESVGGMNEALGQTDAGKLERFNAIASQTREKVGEIALTFKAQVLGNMLPAIDDLTSSFMRLLDGSGSVEEVADSFTSVFDSAISSINEFLPKVLELGGSIINGLVQGITQNIDTLVNGALTIVDQLLGAILALIPSLGAAGTKILLGLVEGIVSALPTIVDAALTLVITFAQGIADSIPVLIPKIVEAFNAIVNTLISRLPELIQVGLQIIIALVQGLSSAAPQLVASVVGMIPQLIQAVTDIIPMLIDAIMKNLPLLLQGGVQIIISLVQGLVSAIPQIIKSIVEMIPKILQALVDNLPLLIDAGIQIILSLVMGITESIPEIINAIIGLIPVIINAIIESLPLLLEAGMQIILGLTMGIVENIPQIITAIVGMIPQIVQAIFANLPQIIQAGIQLIVSLVQGLFDGIPQLAAMVPEIINTIVNALVGGFSAIVDVGKNIVEGIWQGISNSADWLWNKIKEWCGSLLNGIKGFFGIKSPSTVMRDVIGKNLADGVGLGFTSQMQKIRGDMQASIPKDFNTSVKYDVDGNPIGGDPRKPNPTAGGGAVFNQTNNYYSPKAISAADAARKTRNDTRQLLLQGAPT